MPHSFDYSQIYLANFSWYDLIIEKNNNVQIENKFEGLTLEEHYKYYEKQEKISSVKKSIIKK